MRTIQKNDRLANIIIISLSIVVFALVVMMRKIKLDFGFTFDTHIFPAISAMLNTCVSILLILGLIAVKSKNLELHKNIMLSAVGFSILFLITYVMYHITTAETVYLGAYKTIYYLLLLTHIPLAAIILPFILFAVYRALTGAYDKHKKLTKFVWPIWLYVSVTGVIIYFMISPFY